MAPMSEINTTPLVDVMLVLLVIFLITAPLLNQAIPIDLPRAESAFSPDDAKAMQLAIDGSGAVHVNGIETTFDQLESALRDAMLANSQSPELHLRADRQTQYERVAQVMAAANKAGITKISFVTELPTPDSTNIQQRQSLK
jgi:biopolymer transport protein ExbD